MSLFESAEGVEGEQDELVVALFADFSASAVIGITGAVAFFVYKGVELCSFIFEVLLGEELFLAGDAFLEDAIEAVEGVAGGDTFWICVGLEGAVRCIGVLFLSSVGVGDE